MLMCCPSIQCHTPLGCNREERNKLEWAQQRLTELLTGITGLVEDGGEQVVKVDKATVTGEAALTTRKGNKKFAVVRGGAGTAVAV